MSPRAAQRRQAPATLRSGPWKGVYDTSDPFDAGPNRLRKLKNGYVPDPDAGSGAYARNGFNRLNSDVALHTSGDRGQAIYQHTMLDGTILNFMFVAGRVLRVGDVSNTALTITDVTPVGVTIRADQYPIYVTSMVSNAGATTESVMIVNDAQNKPWIASNLAATPITGTVIDYNGAGVSWASFGAPVVWQGAVFFPNLSVGGVLRGDDISWSEPGRPDQGYQQATFDNNLTLVQHSAGSLEALAATNAALYYFRKNSIGVIYGDLATLTTTNTVDAVSVGVGTSGSLTVQQFGNAIYFCDDRGRPYRFVPGAPPEPIWRQMRGKTDKWTLNTAATLPVNATSAIDSYRNLYIVLANPAEPNVLYVFDAPTGTYQGEWTIFDNGTNGGIAVDRLGVLAGFLNAPTLVAIGETSPGGAKGYGWAQRIKGWAVENATWMDGRLDAQHPNIQVVTDRLGEREDVVWSLDRVALLTGNAAKCQVTVETPNTSGTIEGTPLASSSSDETYRLVVGCDGMQGRGPSVTIAPQFLDVDQPTLDQWSLQTVSVVAVPSLAGPEEP